MPIPPNQPLENFPVIKATVGSLLVLTPLVLLSGCGKEQPPVQEAATPAGSPVTVTHPTPTATAVADIDLSGIARAEGGRTVAELFAEKDALAGTSVTVRGKVVKTNAMIMDRNWLHVRDGSGAEGTNDLTVTISAELPQVGDTVVVTGQVTLDKDFGMGYRYPVIIEDAEVTVE
jgi:hypothetical protein